jgi:hypothetical protein
MAKWLLKIMKSNQWRNNRENESMIMAKIMALAYRMKISAKYQMAK